ncbi:YbaB/EbfC family nucleoid-associated protein [Nocardia sp. NPDC049220]|uniref:YbaB/EbfC family nucleoid-associated protein n=1 Tax=Nocardia sp. NPDC049220 TaxID=3155273 RepID=UPI0033DA0EF7
MTNEHRKADLADALDSLQQQVQLVAEMQQRRAGLTGTGTVPNDYVTITVNADNAVIQTQFSPDIGELDFEEIAEAVTAAAQAAIADVARKVHLLTEPLAAQRRTTPTLQQMLEGLTGVSVELPDAPPATLVPPGSANHEFDGTATVSSEGGDYDERPRRRRGATGTSW